MHHPGGTPRGRKWPRHQDSREGPQYAPPDGASDDGRVPHPEKQWNATDWRQWDKNHGHVLWMGTLQEDWTDTMIAGFFLHFGTKVSITRKGRENYCFVSFENADEAREFMTKYNHQQLPGNVPSGMRFNMRPRTRPRWFREGGDRPYGGERSYGGRGEGGGNQREPRANGQDGREDRRRSNETVGRDFHDGRQFNGSSTRTWSGRGRGRQDREWTPSSREDNSRVGDRQTTVRRSYKFSGKRSRSRSRTRSRSRSRSRSRTRSRSRSESRSRSRSSSRSDSSRSSDSSSDRSSSRDGSHSRRRYHSSPSQAPPRNSRASERRPQRESKWDRQGDRGRDENQDRHDDVKVGVGDRWEANSSDSDNVDDEHTAQPNSGGASGDRQEQPDPVAGQQPTTARDGDSREQEQKHNAGAPPGDGVSKESIAMRIQESGACDSDDAATAVANGCLAATNSDERMKTTNGDPVPRVTRVEVIRAESGARDGNGSSSSPRASGEAGARQCSEESERTASEGSSTKWNPQPRDEAPNHAPAASADGVGGDRSLDQVGVQEETEESKLSEYDLGGAQTREVDNDPDRLNSTGAGVPKAEASAVSGSKYGDEDYAATSDGTALGLRRSQAFSGDHDGTQDRSAPEPPPSQRASRAKMNVDSAGMTSHRGEDRRSPYDGESRQRDEGRRSPYDEESRQHAPRRSRDENGAAPGAAARVESQRRISKRGLLPQCLSSGEQQASDVIEAHPPPTSGSALPRDPTEMEIPRVNGTRACLQDPGFGRNEHERETVAVTRELDMNGRSCDPGGSDGMSMHKSNRRSSRSSSTTRVPGLPPAMGSRLLEGPSDDAPQSSLSQPRRGAKRRGTADITLAQVIDHHIARRRVNGTSDVSSFPSKHRGTNCRTPGISSNVYGKGNTSSETQPTVAKSSLPDGSAVVAAAWAHGDVLPLSAAAASHMRLVAPLLAGEPEGRRVVLRTAAAVAAGVVMRALPEFRLEVTGVCRDGLLLELYSNESNARRGYKGFAEKTPALSAVEKRFQSAFAQLVSLDLEIDMMRLPYAEASDTVPTGSSSYELLQWRNDSTITMLRLEPAPSEEGDRFSRASNGQRETPSQQQSEGEVLGIHNDMGPLLPRTGLLESFNVDVFAVQAPSSEISADGSHGCSSVVGHLALVLSDSEVFNGGGTDGGDDLGDTRPSGSALDVPELSARLGCVPPTRTEGGLTWRQVTGLTCVAAVSKLACGPRSELEHKIRLAEGLHSAQIEALASKVAGEDILLVILAGRQGSSVESIASRLGVELAIKGKNPSMIDTKTFVHQRTPSTHAPGATGRVRVAANLSECPSSRTLDLAALRRAVAALLGQARAGPGLLGMGNGVAGGSGWQWCDLVIVHGSEALDVDLLPPRGFRLGAAEALSVFVDNIPQVSVDSLTPVDGSDVRMLRFLATREISWKRQSVVATAAFNHRDIDIAGVGGASTTPTPSTPFDAAGFLNEWSATEEIEEALWRAFRASATVHVNTALPYDLHVLKPVAEPLLRSVKPPNGGIKVNNGGASGQVCDGCRSPTYALARSVLRLLGSCEALRTPPLPRSSVLAGLIGCNP